MYGKYMHELKTCIKSGHYGISKDGYVIIIEDISNYNIPKIFK